MAEMLETASILQVATRHSLVIIDELGRGTSTSEGFGLAWAVSHKLQQLGSLTLFATHFHELTELPGALNLHAIVGRRDGSVCEGEDAGDDLVMTFRMAPGACDESYGIACAAMAGFPETVLKMAKVILSNLEGAKAS
jgi:DNA mismatch repair protein MSH2